MAPKVCRVHLGCGAMPTLIVALLLACLGVALATAGEPDASALTARYAALRDALDQSPYGQPIHLESVQSAGNLAGDAYGVVEHPFADVRDGLANVEHWCDILILHLNVKFCRASGDGAGATLTVHLGHKFHQPLARTHRLEFGYRQLRMAEDYFAVALDADRGPMGTHDYRIMVEAVPLAPSRSFIHLAYSYSYGGVARRLTQAYLATFGANKVGFSLVERRSDGRPVQVGGLRGMLERNTMRYYLALEAWLDTQSLPQAQQPDARLRAWFAATERYALQLHEVDEQAYLDMKRKETQRQQATGGEGSER